MMVRGGEFYLNANAVKLLNKHRERMKAKEGLELSFSDIIVMRLADGEDGGNANG